MTLFNIYHCFKLLFVLVLFLLTCRAHSEPEKGFKPTSSATPSSVKISTKNGFIVSAPKNELAKRNVKVKDLTSAGSVAAKSYDPAPEYYSVPSATTSSSSISTASTIPYNHRDTATASFISKPITFPDSTGRHKYPSDSSSSSSGNGGNYHDRWQLLRGPTPTASTSSSHTNTLQDRISVKNYGTPDTHSLSSGYAPTAVGHSSYGYEARPHYGTAHHHYVDYGHGGGVGVGGGHYATAGHYPASGHGGGGGYYAGTSGEGGIPFDLYGGGNKGHYAGAGGEYSYTYPVDVHEPPAHKGPPELSQKALLAKSFLIPLASAAVLGIAAALVSNPLLLQLGTVSGGVGPAVIGKRRRRDLKRAQTLAYGESHWA